MQVSWLQRCFRCRGGMLKPWHLWQSVFFLSLGFCHHCLWRGVDPHFILPEESCQVSSVCSVPWLSLHWWLEERFLKSWLLTTCIMSPGALLHLPGPHPIIITGTLYRSRPGKQHVNHILLAVLTNTNVSEPHICLHILTAPGVVPAPASAAEG